MTRIALLVALLCLAACAGQPIEPSHYLLRAPNAAESRPLQFSTDYALGSVGIAPYLDQPGLILETPDGTLRAARNHLWAEPVFDAVQNYLRETLSAALGQDLPLAPQRADVTRINVRIDQMHGTRDGQARLIAYWWLSQGDTLGDAFKFAQTRALERDGYAALAQAQAALLTELGEQIAGALRPARP
ncbi:MAG: membrane integrity-associated transporter subunit PqiC [Halioglobus sp.]|nr:membrane integrity-associated transporter subunit PqiC [Halioglobus sp.]